MKNFRFEHFEVLTIFLISFSVNDQFKIVKFIWFLTIGNFSSRTRGRSKRDERPELVDSIETLKF